jgi:hypothetical protein
MLYDKQLHLLQSANHEYVYSGGLRFNMDIVVYRTAPEVHFISQAVGESDFKSLKVNKYLTLRLIDSTLRMFSQF